MRCWQLTSGMALSLTIPAPSAGSRTVNHFTRHPPGTKENPLDTERVNGKARGLMTPVLGAERTEAVIRRVNTLEEVATVRELLPFLAG